MIEWMNEEKLSKTKDVSDEQMHALIEREIPS